MRGALCVFVRDLIVSGVLTDMMRGRPAVYATFAAYDEVAHHSGLERADTLEALRGALRQPTPERIFQIKRGLEAGLDTGMLLESTSFGLIAATEDHREGTRAFLEKRKPVFAGK